MAEFVLCQGTTKTWWDPRQRKWAHEPRPCINPSTTTFKEKRVCWKHYKAMQNEELKVEVLSLVIEARTAPKELGEHPLSSRQILSLARAIAPLVKGKPFG